MDGTVKRTDDRRSPSDYENGYKRRRAAVVSSTVSEELIALNIKNDGAAGSVLKKTNSIDDDVLSVCVNEEDTKFVEDILIAEPKIEKPIRNGKRRRERDKTEFTEPHSVPQSKRIKSSCHESHRSRPKMTDERRTKSMVMPNEKVVQLSEISSSTKSDFNEMLKSDVPLKLSDLFESHENKKIAKIFGDPCLKFLDGKCVDEKCIHGHELPQPNTLRQRLNGMPVDGVRIALNSHARSFEKLLDRYFCTFTEYFGENGHKVDLIEMMSICKNSAGHMQSNCVHVMDGLVKLGISYTSALAMIIDGFKELTAKSMFVLTTLITDKRNDHPTRFLNDLISFYEENFRFNAIIVDRLMFICMRLPYDDNWYTFVRKVVNEWPDVGELDADLLYDFCSMTPRRSALIRNHR